jgi:hypothetical protein
MPSTPESKGPQSKKGLAQSYETLRRNVTEATLPPNPLTFSMDAKTFGYEIPFHQSLVFRPPAVNRSVPCSPKRHALRRAAATVGDIHDRKAALLRAGSERDGNRATVSGRDATAAVVSLSEISCVNA